MSLLPVKLAVRWLQERLERGVVGTRLQEWVWRTRHLHRRNWAEDYLGTVEHPHRSQVVESISSFAPIESVMEVGCASGANLIRLRERFPETKLLGVDVSPHAISTAVAYFSRQGDSEVSLMVGKAHQLVIPDASVDVVLTDAVLMFIAPDRIDKVINELRRVSRKGIVLNEYHCTGFADGSFVGGRWVYDLIVRLQKQMPFAEINVCKSEFRGGDWDRFGTLIEVKF